MGMNSNLPVPTIVSGMISRTFGEELLSKTEDGWHPTCILAESKQAVSMSQVLTSQLQNFFSIEDHRSNREDDMVSSTCPL